MREQKDNNKKFLETDMLRMIDKKLNHLIEILRKKSILAQEDVRQLNEFQIFPKM